MRALIVVLGAALFVLTAIQNTDACTVFVLDDGTRHYYGSNYDWHLGIGYAIINPSGLTKQGWPLPEDTGQPLQWQSMYGSLTFVQYGQGLPKGGMNEAGLVIEGLMLHATEYPPQDDRPYIGSTGQFKQYLLDTCATVADVINHLARIRVAAVAGAPGVHFMVADSKGDCAVIAFLNSRAVIYRGQDLPVKVLTNHDYAKSTDTRPNVPMSEFSFVGSSRGRFNTAANRLATYRSTTPDRAVGYAMDTLAKVSAGSYTQWSVVYDQSARIAYWRCGPDEPLRWIDLKKIDYGCRNPAVALPVQKVIRGEANKRLVSFKPEDNRNLVYQAFGQSRHAVPISEDIWDDVWRWPGKEICSSKAQ